MLILYKSKMLLSRVLFYQNKQIIFRFSTMKVNQMRGQCLVLVQDTKKQLAYMREVQTSFGRGIILKIGQNDKTFIGLYNSINQFKEEIQIIDPQINWKLSVKKIVENIKQSKNNCIFNVEGNISVTSDIKQQDTTINLNNFLPKGRRLQMLSPLIDICHDLKYGDLFTFKGCRNSGKTSTLTHAMHYFSSASNHISLYLDDNPNNRNRLFINNSSRCFGFNNSQSTDIGVYMLGVKCLAVANALKKDNYDVFLAFDKFRRVLQAQWHMLQILQGPQLRKYEARKSINYNSLKLAPISLLNEAYSSCEDNYPKGSLTMTIVNEFQGDLVPQITPYTNNLSHLSTISKMIEFPLQLKLNNNQKIKSLQNKKTQEEKENNIQYYQIMRNRVNQYFLSKQQSQFRLQIHKNQLQDAPWDYFTLLDADWWLKGIKEYKTQSKFQNDEFIKWLVFNIAEQLAPQWKISAIKSFSELLQFKGRKNLQGKLNDQHYRQFVKEAKVRGLISVFKNDYLR